jgi:hypothetical protein
MDRPRDCCRVLCGARRCDRSLEFGANQSEISAHGNDVRFAVIEWSSWGLYRVLWAVCSSLFIGILVMQQLALYRQMSAFLTFISQRFDLTLEKPPARIPHIVKHFIRFHRLLSDFCDANSLYARHAATLSHARSLSFSF